MKLSKMLGVAVVAVLAMAISASAASAAKFKIEGTTAPFTLKAEQVAAENHVFTIEGGLTTKCKKASFEGTVGAKEVSTVEVTPVYSECTAFGLSATVNMHSCKYKFLEPTGAASPFSGKLNVACGSEPATIVAGTCEVTVSSQENLGTLTYKNEATTPKTVLVEANVTGLKYTKVKDGFLCPLNGTGTKEDGTYAGNTTAKGFEALSQKNLVVG
jgi:hypothetical protein